MSLSHENNGSLLLSDLGQTVLDTVVVAMKKVFRSRLEEQLSAAGSILVLKQELQVWQFILCCSGSSTG